MCLLTLLFSCQQEKPLTMRIAVAGNMKKPLEELIAQYPYDHSHITFTSGSSGKLYQQIAHGAPFDLFISADDRYTKMLADAGMVEGNRLVYAYGHLAVWSKQHKKIDELKKDVENGARVVIPNPRLAPYGLLAKTALLEIDPSLMSEAILAEGVMQTNHFIASGNLDWALTANSAEALFDKGYGYWHPLPAKWTELKLAQEAVVIKRKQADVQLQQAKQFLDYLNSKPSKDLLAKYGYSF